MPQSSWHMKQMATTRHPRPPSLSFHSWNFIEGLLGSVWITSAPRPKHCGRGGGGAMYHPHSLPSERRWDTVTGGPNTAIDEHSPGRETAPGESRGETVAADALRSTLGCNL